MSLVRRFLVFQAYLFWQGGFLFYAAVVVPEGTDYLGQSLQGMITQRVTEWLNLIGGIWAVMVAWDTFATTDRARTRRIARWVGWSLAVAFIIVQIGLHGPMDRLVDRDLGRVTDKATFRNYHVVYLWAATFDWALGLALAGLTLAAWRAEDQSTHTLKTTPNPAEPNR